MCSKDKSVSFPSQRSGAAQPFGVSLSLVGLFSDLLHHKVYSPPSFDYQASRASR
jgi:hypothetical protein